MTNNQQKIGKKYTYRFGSDNNIYQIDDVINQNGEEHFIFGPYLNAQGESITCPCGKIDELFLEQPNL